MIFEIRSSQSDERELIRTMTKGQPDDFICCQQFVRICRPSREIYRKFKDILLNS